MKNAEEFYDSLADNCLVDFGVTGRKDETQIHFQLANVSLDQAQAFCYILGLEIGKQALLDEAISKGELITLPLQIAKGIQQAFDDKGMGGKNEENNNS